MKDKLAHIAVCDSDPLMREMIMEYLVKKAYDVSLFADHQCLLNQVRSERLDAIVLDISTSNEDGLSVLKQLRAINANIPLLMLTAAANVVECVVGFELGADDYMAKPMDLRELLARLKAIMRRRGYQRQPVSTQTDLLQIGKCELDMTRRRLMDANGQRIQLTAMEYDLLIFFTRNTGRILNRDQIVEGAHGRRWDPLDRSVDIRISRLRRKIEQHAEKPQIIKTVRGLGYLFSAGG